MTHEADFDDYLTLRNAWIATHPAMRAAQKAVHVAQSVADDIEEVLGDIHLAALEPPMPDEGRLSTDVEAETQQRKAARIEYLAALRVKLEKYDVPTPTVTPAVSALDGIVDEIAKLAPLQDVEVEMMLDAESYAGNASGTAKLDGLCRLADVIDLRIECKRATFELTDFFVGDECMFYGVARIPAEWFSSDSLYAGIKPHPLHPRQTVYIRFHNLTDDPTPEKIEIKLLVESRHTREELLGATKRDKAGLTDMVNATPPVPGANGLDSASQGGAP